MGDRIELKNLAKQAVHRLHLAGEGKQAVAVAEQLDDLVDDDEFWRFQANSLAIFVTPENAQTFRVPNSFKSMVVVSNRFHVKPLFRTVSFSQTCYVLALAQRSVRLVEVSPDLPTVPVTIESLPKDAGRALRGVGMVDHWPSGRLQADEGQKVLSRQFARLVDKAIRPLLAGSENPLVLAAAEPLTSIYRSVNTYSRLAKAMIEGSPELMSDGQLGDRARAVLDEIYRNEVAAWRSLFEERSNQGRATTDISQAARAATFGAVQSLLVDIDEVIPGQIDRAGAISFAEEAVAPNYDLIDEIATRVIATSGRVIGVRKADIPRSEALAAILRYAT
jgi:Bacterial archaeo-eukaryotic release factor family 11